MREQLGRKAFYYIARSIQGSGLLFILYVLFESAMNHLSMGYLFTNTLFGMVVFMAGWMLTKIS